jgi:DNA-directed RNA polymerase specialized sigma24 family protein
MIRNEYDGLLEKREVDLIRQWAKRGGMQSDGVSDVLQEVAMVVVQQPGDWSATTSKDRQQLLWVVTRNVLSKIKRAERRRRQRDEEKAAMSEEAYCDNATPIRLDVQEVVAHLDERSQTVCELLSQGLSKPQIAERMQCGWHTVDRLVRTVRERLEEAGVDAWLQ